MCALYIINHNKGYENDLINLLLGYSISITIISRVGPLPMYMLNNNSFSATVLYLTVNRLV